MVRSDKIDLVNEVSDKLREAQSIVLADFKGITVAEIGDLRNKLRERKVEMHVIKNRLFKRALEAAEYENLDEFLVGNTAISFGVEDPVDVAKVLVQYAKDNKKLIIKGGSLEGKRLDEAGVINLSKMPGRKDLLGTMAADLKQPATKVAMGFNAMTLKIAYAMNALAQKKEEAGETA